MSKSRNRNNQKTNTLGLFNSSDIGADAPNFTNHNTFILLPTSAQYNPKDPRDLAKEFKEHQVMGENDIRFSVNEKPYPEAICTGYAGGKNNQMSDLFSQLATLPTDKPINFLIVAHGSPTAKGKIGMGYDDDEHPNYRIKISELIEQFRSNGLEELKDHQVNFNFRCCNSAYVPLDRHENSVATISKKILEESLIGAFYSEMKKIGFDNISVTGCRGYYRPGSKGAQLSSSYNGGAMIKIEEGTIMIDKSEKVVFPKITTLLKIQNKELDEKFVPVAQNKKRR